MRNGRAGIATIAIVAIVVAAVVVVCVVAVFLLKPANVFQIPSGQVTPKPGATLIGPISISGKASSGTINFTISEDGASITWVSVTLNDVDVGVFSAGSMSMERTIAIPVTNGAFSGSVSGIGEIDGRFTSQTEANGTIDLILEIYQVGTVDLGTWNWSAKAE